MASIDKTEADAATAGKQPKPSFLRSKKFLIGIAILIAVIVIALAVGLGVGLSGNRGDNEPDDKGPQTGPGINRTTIWKPEVGATWQIILRKPINLSADNGAITPDSKVYDLDLFDNTADTFLKLHKAGVNVICYFSAGSWEDWREDAGKFDKVDLGKDLDGWPGEKWLNVSSSSVRDIMKARIKLAASKGCMAIDPDNVDGYKNNNGLGLTSAQAADFVKFLASEAASYNMSTGLKNAADIIDDVLSVVQFSVNEQCIELAECESFARFIKAKKPVFNIEYPKGAPDGLTVQTVDEICSLKGNATGSDGFSKVIKKMNLDGWVQYCDGKRR
ncbi:endo alpha-1,4 polygalactosaminidase precursor [Pochonia chlamydosporia 170]|uniref:alpha-galactosidase n=1 Tax=Pochonia chlamydosporia 170 TaxID=1380566 RepID=A0A179EZM9_METCM|nr:endo alpha-1,4 polygalactosaminidase precursor [Pochonia chlamydosporia 170]OAQ58359.2 endo alpha-1,4 polygalactosaminidase precursor [Pochonia chlamydosporia 170]